MNTTTQRLAIIIKDLRRAALTTGLALLLGCLGFYSISRQLLAIIQSHLHQKLAFFTVAEPFLAHITVSLAMTLFTIMPMLSYFLWRALAKPFKLSSPLVFGFVLFSCLLFYSGAAFCYFITLPFGIDFLLDFQTEQLRPVISISEFVSFVSIFVLAFGLIFELPALLVLLARVGVVTPEWLRQQRPYAILILVILAAVVTPTTDPVSLLLLALPLVPAIVLTALGSRWLPETHGESAPAGGAASDLLRIRPLRNALIASAIVSSAWDLYQFFIPIYGRAQGLSATAIGRNPDASGKMFVPFILGAAFAEGLGVLAVVVGLLVIFANPFVGA